MKYLQSGTIPAHFRGRDRVVYEQMFVETIESASGVLERVRAACFARLGELAVQEARIQAERMELQRAADLRGDWRAAGHSSSAQWMADASGSGYGTAARITRTNAALAGLPCLDEAFSAGTLTLDQVAAAAQFATPETDAELARIAVGQPPSEITRAARTLSPPKVADDAELYRRRALSMTWTKGNRELAISGRLPLEQGVAFKQAIWEIAKQQRAADKQDGVVLEWQQSAADALVSLTQNAGNGSGNSGGVRRSATTMIVHLSADEPPTLEGAGPISPETAEYLTCDARRLFIKPQGRDLVHSRIGRCASYAQMRALLHRSKHCQYPGCTSINELQAHHMHYEEHGGKAELDNLILLCPRHHRHLHTNRIRISGTAKERVFRDASGRLITANQPHAPPG